MSDKITKLKDIKKIIIYIKQKADRQFFIATEKSVKLEKDRKEMTCDEEGKIIKISTRGI